MPILSGEELALLRTHPHKSKEYLAVLQPATVLACLLNGAPSGDPVTSITYDGVTVGSFGDVVVDMTLWIGTAAGGRDKGTCRIRKAATADTLYIAEDSAIDWADDDHLTVVANFEFWVKYPRIVVSNSSITFYKDWEVAYSDQQENYPPVAILGPPDCQFIDPDSGLATVNFVGEHSYAVEPGATISSHAWVFPSGTPSSSASEGTEASPVVVTWDTAGIYWVTLTVTDSNSKTHISRRPVFIFDRTGSGAPYSRFKMKGRPGDLNQHGHTASFEIYGDADQAEFPDGAMVVYFTEDWYGDTKQSIGGDYKFREHIKFVGYVQKESTTKDPETSVVTFETATVHALMSSREGFSCWIKNTGNATTWTEATYLTADRAALTLCRYQSTILDICDVTISGDTQFIKSQEFAAKTTLLQQLQNLYDDLFAHVACNKQGRLYFEIDPQMMAVADRAAIAIVADLTHADWKDRLDLPRPQEKQTSFINLAGVYYQGYPYEVVPVLSKAPGDAPGYTGKTTEISGLILGGQSDGNEKAGLALARDNNEFPEVTLPMAGLWDVFDIVPQEYVRLSLAAPDTKRGIVWTDQKLIPRRVQLSITETDAGRVSLVTIHVEKDSFGPSGVDGDYPDDVPDVPTNPTVPEPTRPPGDYTGDAGPVVAGHDIDGCYWSDFMGESWAAINSGLGTTTILDLIWDPWWFTSERAGNRDPENVILWACGVGFVEVKNGAAAWEDRTPADDPPNSWADTTPPTASAVTYKQLHGDMYNVDTFYALVEWQETDSGNSKWRGWIVKTEDNGYSWAWSSLGPHIIAGWMWPIAASVAAGVVTDIENIVGEPNGEFMCFDEEAVIDLDYGITLSGQDHPTKFRAKVNSPGADGPTESRYRTNVGGHHGGCPKWHIGEGGSKDPNDGTVYAREGTLPSGEFSDGPMLRVWQDGYNCTGTLGYIDYFAVDSRNVSGSVLDVRPLAMDVDMEDGSRIYVTVWKSDDEIYLQQRLASNPMARVNESSLGSATAAEVAAKTYFAVPRCPFILGGSGFGEYVWAFGRWNDGAEKHLAYSSDGGATTANKGSASWDSNHRVGALEVLYDNTVLYAIINHATTPRLWTSPDAGTTWTDLNSVPVNVEFDALTRCTWSADELFIGANAAGALMAAWLSSPYTGSWTDGTGTPSLPTGAGAISAIIWVG